MLDVIKARWMELEEVEEFQRWRRCSGGALLKSPKQQSREEFLLFLLLLFIISINLLKSKIVLNFQHLSKHLKSERT